jgi:hypothetical protein
MFRIAVFLLITGIGLLTSCTNDPIRDLSPSDSHVFITNYSKTADFKEYQTFSIVDSVLVVGNNGYGGTSLEEVDILTLTRIIKNMTDNGYTYVAPDENPDLAINVYEIRNSYLNVVSNPYLGSYWGGGFYGGGYGYPSYYSYYEVQENYWYYEIADFKNADSTAAQEKVKIIWNSQIRGNSLFDKNNINAIVDSVFKQSTYLKAN